MPLGGLHALLDRSYRARHERGPPWMQDCAGDEFIEIVGGPADAYIFDMHTVFDDRAIARELGSDVEAAYASIGGDGLHKEAPSMLCRRKRYGLRSSWRQLPPVITCSWSFSHFFTR